MLQKRGSNGGRPASSCLRISVAIPDRVPGSNMPDDPNVSKTAKRYGAPRDPKRLRAELFEQAGRSPQKSRDAWEGIVLAEVGPAEDDARTRAGGRNSSSGSEGPLCGRIRPGDELRYRLAGCAPGSLIQGIEIFPDGSARPGDGLPVNVIRPGRRALLVGIGSNQAGIDRKAAPSTSPSAMQRRATVSNSFRSRSQSRKRPCLFLENVEWSDTSPSSPSRQNQR